MNSIVERRFRRYVHRIPPLLVAGLIGSAPLAVAAGGAVRGRVTATPAKYLGETVVYLVNVAGPFPARTVSLDQKGMAFVPHVLVVSRGDTVRFLNHDTVTHNVYSTDNEAYDLGAFKPGETRTHAFQAPGVYTQSCSIHPEMLGFVFVGQNPYAAVVDGEGRFAIDGVPPGTYSVAVWNSHLHGAPRTVTVGPGQRAELDFALAR